MMKQLLSLTILLGSLQLAHSQQINTDAIVHFWQVVDNLKKDQPLSDSLWNSFYQLPGNIDYMRKNRWNEQAAEYRKYLEWIFRPSLSDSLKARLNGDTEPADDILDNLLYIRSNEQQLRLYTPQIIATEYLQQCRQLAKQYLPPHKFRPIPANMTIYVMAMTFDAAVQDSSMYFGVTRLYEYDRFRKGAIAGHEMHHQMRVNKDIRKKVSSADSASYSVLDQINSEGCADLIDKMLLLDNAGKVFRGANVVHRLIDNAPQAIRALDSCFRINASGNTAYISDRQFNRITNYSSGHLPGMYMVSIIRRNGMEAALIAHNDNPFRFFYLYNAAAAKDGTHPPLFSETAITYLKELEKRVW